MSKSRRTKIGATGYFSGTHAVPQKASRAGKTVEGEMGSLITRDVPRDAEEGGDVVPGARDAEAMAVDEADIEAGRVAPTETARCSPVYIVGTREEVRSGGGRAWSAVTPCESGGLFLACK